MKRYLLLNVVKSFNCKEGTCLGVGVGVFEVRCLASTKILNTKLVIRVLIGQVRGFRCYLEGMDPATAFAAVRDLALALLSLGAYWRRR